MDLTRTHPRPCLQYYIHRCLGPCVAGLTTDERYAEAARDARTFLEGRRHDLIASLRERMAQASESAALRTGRAAIATCCAPSRRSRSGRKSPPPPGDDTDVLAWYAEPPQVAANLFHLRGGRVVDRRDFYWEDLEEFDPAEFLPSLLKQLYLDAAYLPRAIHVPRDFEDRELLEEILSERAETLDLPYHRVEIAVPQRGPKHAFLELVEKNARHSFEQRFRVLKPSSEGHRRSAGIRAESARAAQAHRKLRHFAHPGLRHRGFHGGLGKRPDEKIRLPQIHHSRRMGQRRFRQHARSRRAPLPPRAGGEQSPCRA